MQQQYIKKLECLFEKNGILISVPNGLLYKLESSSTKEIIENELQEWADAPEEYWSHCHNYNYTTNYKDVEIEFEASIMVDKHKQNYVPYLQVSYGDIIFTHPDGKVVVEEFNYTNY